ncbi:YihA family ribosome biogenesis GTP-binding protein [Rhodanobacter thiooxydans]|uniref:Probable GTP-binding protein EngB n=1 Tax=Rhodanobacter thiooxydans TaxID=416169 RepID=A0A154QGP4_9GAMM|nr:GTP-binding protein [Rhodanobacter thiooxydans]EIL98885.1 GTP-binding protein YsxC [Rhodanobacter thiooxydans LCS2]KZC23336.1 YihA family ribosome biogenesis GTP-binding protein [Rhodanobacter thiooxydans]MCW0201214.1 GTP-binding protein [Rhodanobacter thiooxydans]
MSNPLQGAQFVLAAHRVSQLPADRGAEVAFAGRSNAGKSSALNALTGHKGLARTSKTPGRTQQMVSFSLPPYKDVPVSRAQDAQERLPLAQAEGEPSLEVRLVDLPGYGYAKVPQELREHWRQEIDRYLHQRRSLRGVVLIADIRHPLKEFDRMMLDFCFATGLPCHLLLTKADKLSRNQAAQALAAMRKSFPDGLHATAQVFSSTAGTGVDEARAAVVALLRQPREGVHQDR